MCQKKIITLSPAWTVTSPGWALKAWAWVSPRARESREESVSSWVSRDIGCNLTIAPVILTTGKIRLDCETGKIRLVCDTGLLIFFSHPLTMWRVLSSPCSDVSSCCSHSLNPAALQAAAGPGPGKCCSTATRGSIDVGCWPDSPLRPNLRILIHW